MKRHSDVLAEAVVRRLAAAGCVAADGEADELLAAACDETAVEAMVLRREAGEPLAWITGTLVFCGRAMRVAPGVYVPRRQTEELARRAAALLPPPGSALDLCTGAGAVAAHLRANAPEATVVGIDADERAARCARGNGVPVVVGDLAAPIGGGARFDVITAVAPYVPTAEMRYLPADVRRHEPHDALDGGADGLDVVRRVVSAAALLLRPGGWLLVEIGGLQDVLLGPTLAATGFRDAEAWWDEDGDLRGLAARSGVQGPSRLTRAGPRGREWLWGSGGGRARRPPRPPPP